MSGELSSTDRESQQLGPLRTLLSARTTWLVALAIVAIVVVEGFALSWGGSTSNPSQSPTTSTVSAAASPNICAKGARFRFIQIDFLRYGFGTEPTRVVGHEVALHCGGPDDFQFLVRTTPETVSLRTNATITLMTLAPAFYTGTLEELNNYLAHDDDAISFASRVPTQGRPR